MNKDTRALLKLSYADWIANNIAILLGFKKTTIYNICTIFAIVFMFIILMFFIIITPN